MAESTMGFDLNGSIFTSISTDRTFTDSLSTTLYDDLSTVHLLNIGVSSSFGVYLTVEWIVSKLNIIFCISIKNNGSIPARPLR